MDYKYTLNIYDLEGNLKNSVVTSGELLTIGSGLCNSIRIQIPSINELHLKIYLEKRKVLAFGRDVFLNDRELSIGLKSDFEIGDLIKIHQRSFQVKFTDPNDVIDQSKIIKECPEELCTYLEIEPDLFINQENNKNATDHADLKDNKNATDHADLKDNKNATDHADLKDNKNLPQMMTNQNEGKSITNEEKSITNEEKSITNEEKSITYGEPMEIIHDEKSEILVPMDEDTVKNGFVEKDTVKNVLIEDNEIITNEVCGDIHTKRETNIHREVETSHFIKEGVIYQKVTERVEVEDNITLNEDNPKIDNIKDDFEIQAAVKIIDASSSETKAEGALEEGDLSSVKEAIVSKKEEVNEEIKETVDNGVVVDTPINVVKKQVKDLGNQVIEKEILKEAEEKINQSLEENVNQKAEESVNLELTKLINEEAEESVKEAEESVKEAEESVNLELTKLINEEAKESVNQELTKLINEEEEKKNPFFDISSNKEETVFIKEEEKEKEAPVLSEENIKEINSNNKVEEAEKEENKMEVIVEDEVEPLEKEKTEIKDEVKEETKVEEVEEDKNEEVVEEDKKDAVVEEIKPKKRGPPLRKKKQAEANEIDEQEDEPVKKKKVSSDNMNAEEKKALKKAKKEEASKPKQISKLTVTPRSTRKASMATHNLEPVPVVTPKRVKRNASVSSESKSSVEAPPKKGKNKK